jgi:AraC-like protein
MAGYSKQSAPSVDVRGPVENHSGEVDGYTIDFMALNADIDGAPLLRGLPDDRCQCPHWGYVLKGQVTYRYADRDETFGPGDAFYAPPGHTPLWIAGTEFVQFSPSDEVKIVSEHMKSLMAQGQTV